MKNAAWYVVATLGLMVLMLYGQTYSQENPSLRPGDRFPLTSLPTPPSEKDRAYLGTETAEALDMAAIPADVLVVELLNVYCLSCRRQAPVFGELVKAIEPLDGGDRVKFLGIAAGNDQEESDDFRREFDLPFPVIPDPHFELYEALGGTRTPLTIMLRRNPETGELIVMRVHLGFKGDVGELADEVAAVAGMDMSQVRVAGPKPEIGGVPIRPALKVGTLEERVREALSEAAGEPMNAVKAGSKSYRTIYAGCRLDGSKSAAALFAVVVAREVPCDLCHDVHFIYVLNESGELAHFVPIELSKYGNEPFTEEDYDKLRANLVGKDVRRRVEFRPQVDSVAGATISSSVVFDSVSNGTALLEEFKNTPCN